MHLIKFRFHINGSSAYTYNVQLETDKVWLRIGNNFFNWQMVQAWSTMATIKLQDIATYSMNDTLSDLRQVIEFIRLFIDKPDHMTAWSDSHNRLT